jgi:hypothetical protein
MPNLADSSGIEDEYFVTAGDERVGDVGAEKSGAASDENLHLSSTLKIALERP